MPFLNESDEVVEKQVNDHRPFQDKLLGPLGFKAVFMPTPGFVPFLPPRNTPPASTPPNQLPPNSGTQESSTLPPTIKTTSKAASQSSSKASLEGSRRSTRLLQKKAFSWTNTPDDPVEL
ncbi:hypothetical protein DCAR_0101175 [Daucus carota subsp. sativus]|uniref:Uncharacterized protein n=1 Tax=Daucus carota subsp. sativus TaxID=79200 RepID=A0A162A973_DAUCS|nr:hypothetical protein DCAR_0101175 [Daucus carota subsp. sativus]